MKGPNKHRVYGSDYTKPNMTKVFTFGRKRAGGLTPGRKAGIKKKADGNEDAMAALDVNSQIELLLVADSHFGAMAANYCIENFESIFRKMEGSTPRRLFLSHLALDKAIFQRHDNRGVRSHCATTLISVAIKGDVAAYCSSGDSRFYVLRAGHMREVNDIQDGLFLGDSFRHVDRFTRMLEKAGCIDVVTTEDQIQDTLFQLTKIYKQVKANRVDPPSVLKILEGIGRSVGFPFPIAPEEISTEWHPFNLEMGKLLPSWGSFTLKQGDVLFLASDGLEEEVSGCPLGDIQGVLEEKDMDLETQAQTILDKCLGKRGGGDNLTFIIARV